jgi:uncharacterized protein involved in outer membrane biogenesis
VKRFILTTVIALAVVVIVATIIVGVYLGQIVKKCVVTYGPKMTQASVNVDSVTLSLLTGSASINGLVLGNPSGYTSPHAIAVGTIAVGVDPTTVLSDKVVIRSIRLESPDIIFEGGLTGNNLSQLLANVNSSGKNSGPASTNATNPAAQPASPSQKKLEVDDVDITGAKAEVILTSPVQRQVNVTLPEIHLTDLGKGDEGITAADLTQQILGAITSTTLETVAKDALNLDQNAATLKQAGQNAGKQLNSTLNGLLKGN